jgi:lysophospholipase L1-like esterase
VVAGGAPDEYRPGRFLRVAGQALPGVRRIQQQVGPFAAAWRAANALALEQDGPLWVALGDSMTQGIGAADIHAGWVGQLHDELAAAGSPYRLVNLSRTGARIRDVAGEQIEQLNALGQTPALVTVLVGSNDLMLKRRRAEAPTDFARLLARLPAGAVVATLPQPRAVARAINDQIEAAQAAGQVRIAEMRGGPGLGSWRGALADDHFHPNEVGYARLARAFAAALTPPRP